MPKIRVATALLMPLFLLVGACSKVSPTEIVVAIDTDLMVPGQIDDLVLTATGPNGVPKMHEVSLIGMDAPSLPVTITVTSAEAGAATFNVVGRHGGSPAIVKTITTQFVKNKALLLEISLDSACYNMSPGCGDQTLSTLPPFDGHAPGRFASSDAGVATDAGDAGDDAGPPTSIVVLVDADPNIKAMTGAGRVLVLSQPVGGVPAQQAYFANVSGGAAGGGGAGGWPARIVVTVPSAVADNFGVGTVNSQDDGGTAIVVEGFRATFVQGQQLFMAVRLSDACIVGGPLSCGTQVNLDPLPLYTGQTSVPATTMMDGGM